MFVVKEDVKDGGVRCTFWVKNAGLASLREFSLKGSTVHAGNFRGRKKSVSVKGKVM